MPDFELLLSGGDLRSIGRSDEAAKMVKSQSDFDALFSLLQHPKREVAMRAADAVEKITRHTPEYLNLHTHTLLQLAATAEHKEQKWHFAQLLPRLPIAEADLQSTWNQLCLWAGNTAESRIVRVNALQALAEMEKKNPAFNNLFIDIISRAEQENIPSLTARIKKLKKEW